MPFKIIERIEYYREREKKTETFGRGGRLKVCVVYPNTYKAAMSNLGFQTVYSLFASLDDTYCDRAFLPDSDVIGLFKKGRRKLMGLESELPLQQFDVLAFSISFEPDYFNLLKCLELAGIPLLSKDRSSSYPLIIAGGAAVSINPEIIADFTDLFVIGEGEEVIGELGDLFRDPETRSRKELLNRAALIEGVYVPSLMDVEYDENGFISNVETGVTFPVKRRVNPELGDFAHSHIISPDTEFEDTFLLEISRGCPYNCKFCCVSLHNKPYRIMPLSECKEKIEQGLHVAPKIGLLGAAVGSHPDLPQILDFIEKKGGKVGFSSLRADALKPNVISKLSRLGQNLVTLAPETGSDALRRSINKTLKNEELLETADVAVEEGFREIRLYFMVGLPGETDEDIDDAINMIKQVEQILRRSRGKVFVSINQFVPKPGTPLERSPLEDEYVVLERMERLKKPFYGNAGVEFKAESLKETIVQAFLSRANRNWSGYLLKFYKKSFSNAANRILRLRKKDSSIESLIFKQIPEEARVPWGVIGEQGFSRKKQGAQSKCR